MRALVTLVASTNAPERVRDEQQRHQACESNQANGHRRDRRLGVRAFDGGGEDRGHGDSLFGLFVTVCHAHLRDQRTWSVADVSVAVDDPRGGGELSEAHGTAGVELLS